MGNLLVQISPFIIMALLLYLMVFLPENKRKKRYSEMLNNLKVNDEIMTRGGIIGRIISIKDDYIILESGPDRARVKLDKNGISTVIASKQFEENKDVKEIKGE